MPKPLLPLTFAAMLAAGGALAQAEPDTAIDTDGDGLYSFPEVTAVMPEISADAFTTMDSNGDGLLDMEEVALAQEAGLMPVSEG